MKLKNLNPTLFLNKKYFCLISCFLNLFKSSKIRSTTKVSLNEAKIKTDNNAEELDKKIKVEFKISEFAKKLSSDDKNLSKKYNQMSKKYLKILSQNLPLH